MHYQAGLLLHKHRACAGRLPTYGGPSCFGGAGQDLGPCLQRLASGLCLALMRGWQPRCPARAGLKEEYERAAEWVRTSMPVNASFDASVFETIIRVVGGTLAAHDLTGDQVMLQRCVVLGGQSCRPRREPMQSATRTQRKPSQACQGGVPGGGWAGAQGGQGVGGAGWLCAPPATRNACQSQ